MIETDPREFRERPDAIELLIKRQVHKRSSRLDYEFRASQTHLGLTPTGDNLGLQLHEIVRVSNAALPDAIQ
jgi:hypothetical protein